MSHVPAKGRYVFTFGNVYILCRMRKVENDYILLARHSLFSTTVRSQ